MPRKTYREIRRNGRPRRDDYSLTTADAALYAAGRFKLTPAMLARQALKNIKLGRSIKNADLRKSAKADILRASRGIVKAAGSGLPYPPSFSSSDSEVPLAQSSASSVSSYAASTSMETQESTNTKSTKVDYNIPGYNGSVAIAAGKRLKPCVMNLGKSVFTDNVPDWGQLLNKKGKVTCEFNFRMTSPKDFRSHHYQAFRHKWSHDYSVQHDPFNGGESKAYPAGTITLGPKYYADLASGEKIAYKPPGVLQSSTLDITGADFTDPGVYHKGNKNGMTYFSELNLNDLYDQSYSLTSATAHLLFNRDINTGALAASPANNIGSHTDNHCRVSYPEYWNGGPYDVNTGGIPSSLGSAGRTNGTAMNETARCQFIPCINGGKIDYAFSNKGLNAARVECIVYRIKKTCNLPESYEKYNLDVNSTNDVCGLVKEKHETALQLAYQKAAQARVATDRLQGASTQPEDIISNPKVKLMPVLKGVVASNDPFVEVERQAFIIGAGDKRQLHIKLPGIKENPLTKSKETARNIYNQLSMDVHTNRWFNTPFDDNCYFVCLSLNGLVSTKTVNVDGTDPIPNGSIFTDAEVFCEAIYTEKIQACAFKSDAYGIDTYNQGKVLGDELTTNAVTKSAVILPLSGANFSPSSQIFSPGT